MYADSHLSVASHVLGMHANSGIDESEGTVRIHLGGLGACCGKFLRFLCHERASCAI